MKYIRGIQVELNKEQKDNLKFMGVVVLVLFGLGLFLSITLPFLNSLQ